MPDAISVTGPVPAAAAAMIDTMVDHAVPLASAVSRLRAICG
ncbi:hypothetical protein PQI07_25760 [Methylobacterium sp. 092160098-2]|nr:hypothetical protein [Methylobacterium sp. 092160098-2]MDE4914082.1 hypothetical protein [Methylobacterium sp. 092160098-2]